MLFTAMLSFCTGNASKGVSLGKHADVFLRKCYDDGLQSCWMVIFKVRTMAECTVRMELENED